METAFQVISKLIEHGPYLLAGLAALVWAVAHLVKVRAESNPAKTWEDDWAPTLTGFKDSFLQSVEWLGKIKGWKGSDKLTELLRITSEVERLWEEGKRTEALMRASAYYFDAQGKAQVAGLLSAKAEPAKKENEPRQIGFDRRF